MDNNKLLDQMFKDEPSKKQKQLGEAQLQFSRDVVAVSEYMGTLTKVEGSERSDGVFSNTHVFEVTKIEQRDNGDKSKEGERVYGFEHPMAPVPPFDIDQDIAPKDEGGFNVDNPDIANALTEMASTARFSFSNPHPTDEEIQMLKNEDYGKMFQQEYVQEFVDPSEEMKPMTLNEYNTRCLTESRTFDKPREAIISDNGRDIIARLAESFREERENEEVGNMLEKHDPVSRNGNINMIAVARKFMWHMFTEEGRCGDDPDVQPGSFYDGYRANVAMLIYDYFRPAELCSPFGKSEEMHQQCLERCRECADQIMKRIFN